MARGIGGGTGMRQIALAVTNVYAAELAAVPLVPAACGGAGFFPGSLEQLCLASMGEVPR